LVLIVSRRTTSPRKVLLPLGNNGREQRETDPLNKREKERERERESMRELDDRARIMTEFDCFRLRERERERERERDAR